MSEIKVYFTMALLRDAEFKHHNIKRILGNVKRSEFLQKIQFIILYIIGEGVLSHQAK